MYCTSCRFATCVFPTQAAYSTSLYINTPLVCSCTRGIHYIHVNKKAAEAALMNQNFYYCYYFKVKYLPFADSSVTRVMTVLCSVKEIFPSAFCAVHTGKINLCHFYISCNLLLNNEIFYLYGFEVVSGKTLQKPATCQQP